MIIVKLKIHLNINRKMMANQKNKILFYLQMLLIMTIGYYNKKWFYLSFLSLYNIYSNCINIYAIKFWRKNINFIKIYRNIHQN